MLDEFNTLTTMFVSVDIISVLLAVNFVFANQSIRRDKNHKQQTIEKVMTLARLEI